MLQDDAVMGTNDDASICKRFAVQMGYWKDKYLQYFMRSPERKAPEISRGYFARVAGMKAILDQAVKLFADCQIVNLGAGFDTLYWRLEDEGIHVRSFTEVDLPGVTSKKCHAIRSRKPLLEQLAANDNEVKFSTNDLHAGNYHLVGVDMRQLSNLQRKLLQESGLNPSIPTIVLSECVLVYVDLAASAALLRWFAEAFQIAVFINYEQVNMKDKFGQVMIENLKKRGCDLAGVSVCTNLQAQEHRFTDLGWETSKAWDMNEVYHSLPREEITRIERLEFLDETELLEQLLQHYCITVATKGIKEEELKALGFT